MTRKSLMPFRRKEETHAVVPHRDRTDDPFLRIHEELDHLFESVFPSMRGPRSPWRLFDDAWPRAPQWDVTETEEEVRVTAELPGVEEKDLDVRLDGDHLLIRGERKQEQGADDGERTHRECVYGTFERSLRLGRDVDPDKVQATYRNGVLTVRLPKTEDEREHTRKIKVHAG